MNNKVKKAAVALTMALSLSTVAGFGIANAQGPNGQTGPGMRAGGVLMCSTTNYTDVAAKAIGIQSADLRKALVGGKNLTAILSGTKVTVQNVEDALKTAYLADLDQALKDGLVTQAEYDQLKARLSQTNPAANATPAATQQAGQPAQPNLPGQPGTGMRRGMNGTAFLPIPRFNEVKPLIVASKAIGISCADLVKAMETGQSVAQVATSKNVQVQTVIDALSAAEKAAITQDVQEGLLAQVQADARIAQLVNRAGSFVYDAHIGGHDGMGGPNRRDGQDGRNGQLQAPNGQNSPQPVPPQSPSGLPSDPSANNGDAPQQVPAPDFNG